MAFRLSDIDNSWTLFLDRDGVINEEKENSYIFNPEELQIYSGAAEAIGIFSSIFSKILIATNQKGIGKGLMTVEDLNAIHSKLYQHIAPYNGAIAKIYFCPDLEDNSPNRKPQPGMALQAQKDYPEIEFSKSIMVGNRMSDMSFGRNAGMHTVFLATTHPETPFPDPKIDYRFDSLLQFAKALQAEK